MLEGGETVGEIREGSFGGTIEERAGGGEKAKECWMEGKE